MKNLVNILSGFLNIFLIVSVITIGLIFDTKQAQAATKFEEQLICMAQNVYFESRSETMEGMVAVAFVTLNRVEHRQWPNSVCGVVYQPSQFSWTNQIDVANARLNSKAWNNAVYVARQVMNGHFEDPTNGATFYHADYIRTPRWARQMQVSTVIGAHVFYVWDGKWN